MPDGEAVVTGSARGWRFERGWIVPALLAAGFAVVPMLAAIGPEKFTLSLATRIAAWAIAALSLDLLIGVCGLVSLGHAAFLGIGSYAAGILAAYGFNDLALQIPAAILAALVFGTATGTVALRTRGVYFIMITLAFAQMLFFFATSLSAFGGDDGMTLPERGRIFGLPVLRNDTALFALTAGCLLLTYIACRALVASRFGRVLRGARDNAQRMNAIGFAPRPYFFVTYLISGAICAVAGVLLTQTSEFVSPALMAWQRSGDLVFMVAIGGIGSLHGAVLGAVVFVALSEGLSRMTEHWHIVFGPLLILSVLTLRGGIARAIAGGRA